MKKEDKVRKVRDENLVQQGKVLERIIKRNGISKTGLAKLLGISRQTIHQWIWGDAMMPEYMAVKMANIFNCQPAELRYDISVSNPEDLISMIVMVEKSLAEFNLELPVEKRAIIISTAYEELKNLSRMYGNEFAKNSINTRVNDVIHLAL